MKHLLVNYQREVHKGKLTAVASFEKLPTFRTLAIRPRKVEDSDSSLSKNLFQGSYCPPAYKGLLARAQINVTY